MIHNKLPSRRNQAGLTLIELMIGIAIVLLITAVTVAIAANVRSDQKTSELHTQIVQISSSLSGLAPNGDYTGITEKTLIDAGKVPASWIVGTGESAKLMASFGGPITVAAGTGTGLNITVSDVPSSACASVLTNVQQNFTKLTVGSTEVTTRTPAAFATACANGPVDLVFGMCASPAADCFAAG